MNSSKKLNLADPVSSKVFSLCTYLLTDIYRSPHYPWTLDVSGMTMLAGLFYFEAFQKVISEILDVANLTKCMTAVPGYRC